MRVAGDRCGIARNLGPVLKLILLIVPLGLDTLAVSVVLGVRGLSSGDRLRIGLVLAGFEAVMPLIGLLLGRALGTAIGTAGDYLAIAVLAAVGIWMLASDDDSEARGVEAIPAGRWVALVGLGLSVSMDELAIGFGIGLLHLPVWVAVGLIAGQAFVVAQLGMRVGARGAGLIGERAERLAGLALLALAVLLLLDRLGVLRLG